MSLTIKEGAKNFYARLFVGGKRKLINLYVEIKGRPPRSLKDIGDLSFERSRMKAQEAHDVLQRELKEKRGAEKYLEKLYEIKSGENFSDSIPLAEMFDAWKEARDITDLSHSHIQNVGIACRKLETFIEKDMMMNEVTTEVAMKWVKNMESYLVARTRNHHLTCVRSVFELLKKKAKLAFNPFSDIPMRRQDTIHREPLTDEDINKLLEMACPVLRPVMVTGFCTAMREGDCATLKNECVDLDTCFATVKTSKTGAWVDIPIFPEFVEVLKDRAKGEYCWPEAANLYLNNRDALVNRITKLFKDAGVKKYIERNGRKQSVKDFHSLRVTWVTKALTRGVPIEMVKKVTGHTTVDTVLKHYFRPGREDMRKALGCMMNKG